jgi:SAM-dependent methyltransferase
MMNSPLQVFDRNLLRARRERAAPRFAEFDFLYLEIAERLADRLRDVKRRFPSALLMGIRGPRLSRLVSGQAGAERLICADLSPASLDPNPSALSVVLDEECLPFAQSSLDLVLSCLSFHWINDLPGALLQINRALKPDGLMLAAFFGGGTLKELRSALLEAEVEESGGAAPRISPFIELADAAQLLQRAGFALPVADLDVIDVSYPNALKLIDDLRGMGEANALRERARTPLLRRTLARATEIYQERFRRPDGKVNATFEVIFMTAWAPAAGQPKPLAPGSAQMRLAEALGTTEIPGGEKPDPG